MQVLIIAGGEGKRMKPLTTHKSLLTFLGKPLIKYLIESFQLPGATYFVVTGKNNADEFGKVLSGSHIRCVVQSVPRGMADAVLAAKSILDPHESLIVVSAAKLLGQNSYTEFLAAVQKNPEKALLASYKTESYKEGGYLSIKDNQVTGVSEKPGAENMPSKYYKLVLDYFPITNTIMEKLTSVTSDNDDAYELAITEFVRSNPTEMIVVDSQHVSLKAGFQILDVMQMALKNKLIPGIAKSAQIAKTAMIDGNVQIDDNAKILDYAVIKGPCYIGRNVVIGNHTLIRESSIESDCEIGFGSEIARSYLGPGTKGHKMYVGDSIIEGKVNLSAGTVLANYRFDHHEVVAHMEVGKVATRRKKFGSIIAAGTITGVNTSLMPGTVVGPNVTIGSGCVVKGFIPANAQVNPLFSEYEKE